MCGIAGYFLKDRATDKDAIALALMGVEMESRGDQSWGILSDKRILKGIGPISQSYAHHDREPNFVLHTRWATHGDVTVENSHPHKVGSIWGVHNGIIGNHYELNAMYERDFAVDSQHIFAHLEENRNLNDLEGYGTIVYRKDGQWYIGRFNNGDLCVAKTQQGLFFASTQSAVEHGLNFAGIAIESFIKVPDNCIYSVHADDDHPLRPMMTVDMNYISFTWQDTRDKGAGWREERDDMGYPKPTHYTKQGDFGDGGDMEFCFCCNDWLWLNENKVSSKIFIDMNDNLVCERCARKEYDYIDPSEYEFLTAGSYKNGQTICDCCGEWKVGDDVMVACFRDCADYCEQCFYEEYGTDSVQPLSSLTSIEDGKE